MTKTELINLIEEGHEIEFKFEGKRYSITYYITEEKEQISFCEFYKETTEVDTVDELCNVERDGKKVIEMISSLTKNDFDIY